MESRPNGPLTAFRIADRRHPIYDGRGASIHGGRWTSPGYSVIHASLTYAGALLEILIHANIGRLANTYQYVEIQIPASVSMERANLSGLPHWDSADLTGNRKLGDDWLNERRSAVLIVPSAATIGIESNVLINPAHPEFSQIAASAPMPIRWDPRLVKD